MDTESISASDQVPLEETLCDSQALESPTALNMTIDDTLGENNTSTPAATTGTTNNDQLTEQLTVECSQPSSPDKSPTNIPKKQKVSGTKIQRRSQRVKRKRVDQYKQIDTSDDNVCQEYFIHMEKHLESKIDDRLGKLEQKFEKMMTTFTNTLSTTSQKHTKGMEAAIESLKEDLVQHIDQSIDQKIDNKVSNIQTQLEELKKDITLQNTAITKTTDTVEKLDIDDIQKKIDSIQTDQTTTEQMKNTQAKIDELTMKIQELTRVQTAQGKKQEDLEFHSRKLNVVFEGVILAEQQSCKDTIESIIARHMHLDMAGAVDIAHTLGPRTQGETQPIIVRFRSVTDKSRVLENASILRDHDIYVRPDFPKSISDRRAYLAKSLRAAKATDSEARLFRDKLRFNNRMYTVENIHEAPIGDEKHTLYTDTQVRFYGYRSPFSNFFKSDFTLNRNRYICVEQALQAARAYRHNDRLTWTRIMRETNPVTMKRLGKRYSPRSEEEQRAEQQFLLEAVNQKFQQSNVLKQKLADTGTKIMMECNPYDNFYSTGCKITDNNLDTLAFQGQNVMGVILQQVREKIGK